MALIFECENCGKGIIARSKARIGKLVRCKSCDAADKVPDSASDLGEYFTKLEETNVPGGDAPGVQNVPLIHLLKTIDLYSAHTNMHILEKAARMRQELFSQQARLNDSKIAFDCSCGERIVADKTQSGEKIKCPWCDSEVIVPSENSLRENENTTKQERRVGKIEINCPKCGRTLRLDEEGIGQYLTCPGCSWKILTQGARVIPQVVPQTSGTAVWSLVLGILSLLCLGPLAGIPAVICGHEALSQIKNSGGDVTGDRLANGGLVMGYISIALSCIVGLLHIISR